MKLRRCFELKGDEPFFQGHFPEVPILPGVVQLEFAHRTAEALLACPLVMKEVRRLKFVRVIEPGGSIAVEVELRESAAGREVSFVISKQEVLCSSGILVY